MESLNIFDVVVISLTVFLGLKGLLSGFVKEVFSLIGLVGGIFVSSRFATQLGELIAPILALENQHTISLLGFILGFIGFWIIAYMIGSFINKLFQLSGLSTIDRMLGCAFGSAKIFLFFAIITYGLTQIKTIEKLMEEKGQDSFLYPYLLKTGAYIVQLDTAELISSIERKINNYDSDSSEEDKEETSTMIDNLNN